MERDVRIDNIKGFLILLVVTGHFLLPIQGETRIITNIFYFIYAFHMPAFVFISGVLSDEIYSYKTSSFRIDKFISILWLYIIFKLIVFFPEIYAYGRTTTFPDFFNESGAPWYLMSLCLWYLMIVPVRSVSEIIKEKIYLKENQADILMLAFIIILSTAAGYMHKINYFLSLDRTFAFAPFFFAGYFIGKKRLKKFIESSKYNKIRLLICISGVTIGAYIFLHMFDKLLPYRNIFYGSWYAKLHSQHYPEFIASHIWIVRPIWYIIGMLMTMTLAIVIPNKKMYILSFIGQRTLAIYILHRPIRDILLAIGFFSIFNAENKATLPLMLIISVAVTIILAMPPFYTLINFIYSIPNRLIKRNKNGK